MGDDFIMICIVIGSILIQIMTTILIIWAKSDFRSIKEKILFPFSLAILSLLAGCLGTIITCIEYKTNINNYVWILTAGLGLICNILALVFLCQTIIYNEEGFTIGWHRLYLKKYSYEELSGIEQGVSYSRNGRSRFWHTYLMVGKKRLDSQLYGKEFKSFLGYACQKYENNGARTPLEIKNRHFRFDLYNGNLICPNNYTIGPIIMVLVWLTALIILLYDIVFNENVTKDSLVILYVLLGLFAISISAFLFVLHIGRNPHKYSKRIRKIFFHDEDWNVDFNKTEEE